MRSKMTKKLIAFLLCMVLVICNSVSILADTPAPEAVSTQQVKETKAAPEVETTTKKEETTEATTEKKEKPTEAAEETTTETKEGNTKATTEVAEETTTETKEDKTEATTEVAEETTTETKKETTTAEESSETSATSEETTEADKAEETTTKAKEETAAVTELKYENEEVVITVSANEGVFPQGTTFEARKIESNVKEYSSVKESVEKEIAKKDKDVLDFIAYDVTFYDKEGKEIEPNGEVEVAFRFNDVLLGGVSEKNNTVDVVHIKNDNTTETVKSNIGIKNEKLQKAEFIAEEFSIYAITASGIVERYNSTIAEGDFAVVEFWDKDSEEGNQDICFEDFYGNNYEDDKRYLEIQIYVDGKQERKEDYCLDMTDTEYENVNLQTTVKPGDNYYVDKCVWKGAGKSEETFGGSSTTSMYKKKDNSSTNILKIYLESSSSNSCNGNKIEETKNISVDLYNYSTEEYNERVGLNSGSILLRSAWGNYKADGYKITNGDNKHNESCGADGIYYGLVSPNLLNGNIQFNKTAKFFDDDFDSSVGTKYSDVNFEFCYDENTSEYKYNSSENHVHFDEENNTIYQYEGVGPSTLSDSKDTEKNGFFPFNDEQDNMTDYGFGMRLDVEFQLTDDGMIKENVPMQFHFSGDDDVWVFIDGKLALDLGGLHSRRAGTIDFANKEVTYEKEYTAISGEKPDTNFLKDLEPGAHTLTMYYLERGGNDSNCEITFNLLVINREGMLDFKKVDSETQEPLSGVSFSLYDTEEISEITDPIDTAVSDENGQVVFDISKLDVSKEYYLKESSTPFGYKENTTIYPVSLHEEKDGINVRVYGEIKNSENQKIEEIENIPKENIGGTTTVTVQKQWQNVEKVPVELTLYANGEKVQNSNIENPITLKESPWEWTWKNLPGDTNYTVEETVPAGYQAVTETTYAFDINTPYEVVTPCNQLERTLGSNGVVAIKKGNQYFVWTTVELSEQEKRQLLVGIREITNGFDYNNTVFQFGTGTFEELDGSFTFDYTNNILQMSIDAEKAWSWFLLGTYTKTVSTVITNSIDTKTIDIPVEKVWECDLNEYNYNSVTVQLYQNGEKYESPVKILKESGWKTVFKDLPYYSTDSNGKVIVNQYTIKETYINDTLSVENCKSWLVVSITGNAEKGFVITNAIPEKWCIQKVSNSEDLLGGAEFTLTRKDEEKPCYYGKSENGSGIIAWWINKDDYDNYEKEIPYIPDGEYILKEEKAPNGYMKSEITWEIVIENLELISIKDSKGNIINPKVSSTRALEKESVFVFVNTPVYELPSAGGPGIYWYTLSGALLMMGAALIVYKQQRKREVLLKK